MLPGNYMPPLDPCAFRSSSVSGWTGRVLIRYKLELEAKIGSFPKRELFSVRTEELEFQLELGFKEYGFLVTFMVFCTSLIGKCMTFMS
jgi:hypothetical protein